VAHAYVDVVGEKYDHPEYRLGERLAHGTRHAAILLLGGIPVIVVFGLERAAGVDEDGSATGALVGLTLLLGIIGYAAARRGRVAPGRAVLEGLVVALIGVAILLLKLLLV